MFTLNIGIVVVRNAEKPTTSGLCSWIASMNVSGATWTPMSIDLEAGALEHDVDEVLADVVHVALDRAHQERADRLGAGVGEQRPEDLERALIARPAISISGTKKSPRSKRAPDLLERRDERVEEHLLGLEAGLEALR